MRNEIGWAVLFSMGILLSVPGYTCDCGGASTFLPAQPTLRSSDLIVHAKVLSHGNRKDAPSTANPSSMEVNILKSFGTLPSQTKLIVEGDRGADCLASIREFPVGSEWIFRLAKNKWKLSLALPKRNFSISSCGLHYLKVENGRVKGRIFPSADGKEQVLTLDQFAEKLR